MEKSKIKLILNFEIVLSFKMYLKCYFVMIAELKSLS